MCACVRACVSAHATHAFTCVCVNREGLGGCVCVCVCVCARSHRRLDSNVRKRLDEHVRHLYTLVALVPRRQAPECVMVRATCCRLCFWSPPSGFSRAPCWGSPALLVVVVCCSLHHVLGVAWPTTTPSCSDLPLLGLIAPKTWASGAKKSADAIAVASATFFSFALLEPARERMCPRLIM